jgi:enoyl-CoA hydratase/carnithine racemase
MEDIKTETVRNIGWIVLDRPSARNAARPQMMQEICAAIDRYVGDANVRGIAIIGAGPHFLAGGDFEFLGNIADGKFKDLHQELYTHFQGATRRIFRCPKPTIAAISGGAITVGCELSLACDFRIADETAFFHESWLQLGLIPPLGGTMLLPRIVGLAKAKEMILNAEAVRAPEALRIGLISELVPSGLLRERAQTRMEVLSAMPAGAFRLAKEALHRGLESTMDHEWQATVLAQTMLLETQEFRERLAKVR